ncbi:MAG: hypothetical protein NC903_00935, partial [Candidatus Omnitrophica bacterium]|nr:hypothetical protein [Candidatus Omnitrophota bacterium]
NKFFILCFIIISLFLVKEANCQRDPFISLITPDGRLIFVEEEKKEELKLEGILYNPYGGSSVIVNGEILKIGDWIGNYQVYKIELNKVVFLKEGNEVVISLEKEE